MKDYHWAAIPIVVLGTGIVLWAGYKAGQKNAGTVPKQLPVAIGGLDTATIESNAESDAEDAAIFNIVSDVAPALL